MPKATTFARSVLVLLFWAGTVLPAVAQWTFVDTGSYKTTDLAIRGDVMIVTCDDALCGAPAYVSTDGGTTWTKQFDAPIRGRNVVATADGFAAQFNGNDDYTIAPDGVAWTKVGGIGSNTTSYFFDETNGRLYATTQSANLAFSDDNGVTWTDAGLVSSRDNEFSFVHARGATILVGYNQSGGSTYLSTDGGTSWTELNRPQPKGGFIAPNGDLYVAQNVNVSLVTPSTALFRSQDGGQTWTQLFAAPGRGFQGRSTPLRTRVTIYAAGSSILFTANDKVYVSTDGGTTWEDQSEGITPDDTNSSAAVQFIIAGNTAYMVLYSSRDRGSNAGYGLYQRPVAELDLETSTQTTTEDTWLSLTLALDAVYPNPFQTHAHLRYTLERPGRVQLSIHDLLGREVARLVDEWQPAGAFEHTWQADTLPSGSYLVRITQSHQMETRLVTLVR